MVTIQRRPIPASTGVMAAGLLSFTRIFGGRPADRTLPKVEARRSS
jgi:hypothetical protein